MALNGVAVVILEGVGIHVLSAVHDLAIRRAVPSLARVLREGEALVRSHAAWALGRIGGVTAQDALAAASRREADREVLEELALAIEALR